MPYRAQPRGPRNVRPYQQRSRFRGRSALVLCIFLFSVCLLCLHAPTRRRVFGNAQVVPVLETATTTTTTASPAPTSGNCWIFTHLQKCGGSTVKKILFDHWGDKSTTYDSYQWKNSAEYTESAAANLASNTGWTVAAGGYTEALRRTAGLANGGRCKWFTVFRHPIPRMVSAYFYCRIDPTDQLCASAFLSSRTADLESFAKHWGNFAMRQFALALASFDDVKSSVAAREPPIVGEEVLKIPGWYLLKVYLDEQARSLEHVNIPDLLMYQMLQPVQDLLRDSYSVVGILEEFNTTLSLFDAALDMPGLNWRREFRNAGKANVDLVYEKEKREALKEAWTNSEIKKYMQLDLLLYEHAVLVFHRQAQLYGLE